MKPFMHYLLLISIAFVAHAQNQSAELDAFVPLIAGKKPVPSPELSSLAACAFRTLQSIPAHGWRGRKESVTKLVDLRGKLEEKAGVRERHLALSLQECIDKALLGEVHRDARDNARKKKGLSVPTAKVKEQDFLDLLHANRIPEDQYAEDALSLDCAFAEACREQEISASDVLAGRVRLTLPRGLRKKYEAMLRHVPSDDVSAEALFARMLVAIDRARDRRLLFGIRISHGSEISDMRKWYSIIESALSQKTERRVSTGLKNHAVKVIETLSSETSREADDLDLRIAHILLPYLENTAELPIKLRMSLDSLGHGQRLSVKR